MLLYDGVYVLDRLGMLTGSAGRDCPARAQSSQYAPTAVPILPANGHSYLPVRWPGRPNRAEHRLEPRILCHRRPRPTTLDGSTTDLVVGDTSRWLVTVLMHTHRSLYCFDV